MSVLIETSVGDITIDLYVEYAPKSCENFLKLCKVKYFNFAPIHTIQPGFSCQTGDPVGPGSEHSDGGTSIWGLLDGPASSRKTFVPELHPKLKHAERGTVSFATVANYRDPEQRDAGSQFIITLGDNLDYLDGKAAIFGRVVEGFDILEKINAAFIDEKGRPLKDIRIKHTIVLDEAEIPDPPGLVEPSASPVPTAAQLATVRIADDDEMDDDIDEETADKLRRQREARQQALTLEMVGDLPFAEVAPPENILFVAKLNPVTQDEDLELIFSRFGKILSCEIIRDKKTGDSLQYAFVEFAKRQDCELAFSKMKDVLVDDHRIFVDFSQSVSKIADVWRDATNKKRAMHRGGFGGIAGLEKKTQYRAYGEDRTTVRGSKYDMLVGGRGSSDTVKSSATRPDARRRSPVGRRNRSRSPPPQHQRHRSRSRSDSRDRTHKRYGSGRDDRYRDRQRHHDSQPRHHRDRDRDWDRR